jgi:hypothetical protein
MKDFKDALVLLFGGAALLVIAGLERVGNALGIYPDRPKTGD